MPFDIESEDESLDVDVQGLDDVREPREDETLGQYVQDLGRQAEISSANVYLDGDEIDESAAVVSAQADSVQGSLSIRKHDDAGAGAQ